MEDARPHLIVPRFPGQHLGALKARRHTLAGESGAFWEKLHVDALPEVDEDEAVVKAFRIKTPVLQEPEKQTIIQQHANDQAAAKSGSGCCRPLSEQEVVGFDVGVDDADTVQLLHHVQDAYGEVQDERLRHHFVTQVSVDVHGVLKAAPQQVSETGHADMM